MADTYYKYAEREADSQINWFEVGKGLTDMIKKEVDTREAKKQAIDEASRKFGQELDNAPQGNSDLVNKWTTNYAGDMQEYRLLTLRLLKQGQLKPKDYALINQNTLDGTKNLFNLSKEYQQEFDVKTERRKTDKSSASETQFMAMVEGYANLGNTKALIDPPTGAISVGKMEKGPDGVMKLKEGNDNYMTVNQLRQRIKTQVDKYQLNDDLEAETKLLGGVVTEVVTKTGSSTQTGFMTKVTDPTKRKGLSQEGQEAVDAYMKTENQIVEAKLSNPLNISSVLFDWTGGIDPKTNKPYQVETNADIAKTSSHYILWGYKDGIFQPDFESTPNGKLQKEEAATYVKNKFRSMLEQKTEIKTFSQPTKQYPPKGPAPEPKAPPRTTGPDELYANYVNTSIPVLETNDEKAISQLNPILNKLGFTANTVDWTWGEIIKIKNKDGVESEEIDLSDPQAQEVIKSFLIGNAPGKTAEDQMIFLNSLKNRGVFGAIEAPVSTTEVKDTSRFNK
jgi:hypothetical protein